ncbi:MAG: hypothetical protein ABI597_03290 [Gammaproteobacteria bacterium]
MWNSKNKNSDYAKINSLNVLDIKLIAEVLHAAEPSNGLKFTTERLITPSTISTIAIRNVLKAFPVYQHAAKR